MSSLAVQRLASLLQARRLDHTLDHAGLPRSGPVLATGLPDVDARLSGGWPHGEISELTGPRSSGRTGLLTATLASVTRAGGTAALVDSFDRFDPVTAAEAGVDLDRVLWVRGSAVPSRALANAVRAFDLIIRAGGFTLVALDLADAPLRAIRALPLTTWLRLAHANEGRETVGLLVSEGPIGRSARGVSLHLEPRRRWLGTAPQQRRFGGFSCTAVC